LFSINLKEMNKHPCVCWSVVLNRISSTCSFRSLLFSFRSRSSARIFSLFDRFEDGVVCCAFFSIMSYVIPLSLCIYTRVQKTHEHFQIESIFMVVIDWLQTCEFIRGKKSIFNQHRLCLIFCYRTFRIFCSLLYLWLFDRYSYYLNHNYRYFIF